MCAEKPLRGELRVLMEAEKRMDGESFHAAYLMTSATLDELLELISPQVKKQTTTFRDPFGVSELMIVNPKHSNGRNQHSCPCHE